MKNKTVLAIGLGEIGLPLSKLIEEAGYITYKKDMAPLELSCKIDFMTISIPFKDKKSFIAVVSEYVSRYLPTLVVINSTTLPGTCQLLASIHKDTMFVHSPTMGRHRKDAPAMMLEDIKAYSKFIGADSDEAYNQAREFFNSIGLQSKRMSTTVTSELAKLLETTYSGILIGWAQESDTICNRYEVDLKETLQMIEEANQRIEFKRPTNIFPGFIGGHCIMPNIDLLLQEVKSDYLEAIKKSNEKKK